MNPFTPLPNETFIHCISGHSLLDRKALKIFICSGVKLKSTCKDLSSQVDQCWNQCLDGLAHAWQTDLKMSRNSYQFIYNWITGKSKMTEQTLHHLLKNGFSLAMKPNDENHFIDMARNPSYYLTVPYFWAFHPNKDIISFSRFTTYGDASFFNIQTGKFLGEILGNARNHLYFDHEIKPIFYKNDVIILFQGASIEIRLYEIKDDTLDSVVMR